MVHENKIYLSISIYSSYACIYKRVSSASNPVEPFTRKKKPFCRRSWGMRIAYKYSDRSSGPLGGKVTHTFLLINSPCRLADHSSVHSFKCFSHGPQLYVWFPFSLFKFISQPLKIRQGSTSSNWTEVWYILSASITLSVAGPTAKEAGS